MTPLRQDERRLLAFLALSAALHVLWLGLPLHRPITDDATPSATLNVLLEPTAPEQKSAVATRHLRTNNSTSMMREPAAALDAPIEAPPATVDLGAAFATARNHARNAPPPAALDKPRLPVTVEAAIATAMQPDDLVETRGANGEYITKTRRTRCVTPIYVPHFLEGKTMLTQCEALKG